MVTGSRDIDVCSARFLGPKFGREGLQRARLRFSGFLSRRESLSLPPGELSFPAARSADEPGSPARREALPPGTLPPGALSLPAGGRAGWLSPAGRESVLQNSVSLRGLHRTFLSRERELQHCTSLLDCQHHNAPLSCSSGRRGGTRWCNYNRVTVLRHMREWRAAAPRRFAAWSIVFNPRRHHRHDQFCHLL